MPRSAANAPSRRRSDSPAASPVRAARLELIPPNGNARKLTSKGGFIAPAGSLVVIEAPGSGGYGPPSGRERARLSEDLLDGYVTSMAARRDYGVEPT